MINLSGFSPIIESTMTDTMDGYRYVDYTNDDGTTETKMSASPVYSNHRCRLSFKGIDNPGDGEIDKVPLTLVPKLFCPVTSSIMAGDYVIVKRKSNAGDVLHTYAGTIGLPAVYETHKEVLLSIEESA